jgi:NTP pyrophosphatase (non-canonical NTP hydrolase)
MFAENQYTITEWANSTFGETKDFKLLFNRMYEELEELKELVDYTETDDLMSYSEKLAEELADVFIVGVQLFSFLQSDLITEVNIKMHKNRARKWQTSGDGVGQHID